MMMHITDEEEQKLQKLRSRLFDSHWNSDAFKKMLRDVAPSEVYTEDSGFRIFIGNYDHAVDLLALEVKGITYILNMAASDPTCQTPQEVYGERYKCMRIKAGDMPGYDLSQHFPATVEFIDEARENKTGVLVHCVAGVSRSATIVIAYLMQKQGWSLEIACKHVHARRAKVYPNVGFLKQLMQLEKELKLKRDEPSGRACSTS